MSHRYRVIKIGGSLLDSAGWTAAFRNWYRPLAAASIVDLVLIGGGRGVDRLRDLDAEQQLGDVASHFLAIRTMSITLQLAARQLGLPTIADVRQLPASGIAAVDIESLLDCATCRRKSAVKLPVSWAVTSDSLAVWLAGIVSAEELVLLKSCPPPNSAWQHWSAAGYVDAFFPVGVPAGLRISAVDLRGRCCSPTASGGREPSG